MGFKVTKKWAQPGWLNRSPYLPLPHHDLSRWFGLPHSTVASGWLDFPWWSRALKTSVLAKQAETPWTYTTQPQNFLVSLPSYTMDQNRYKSTQDQREGAETPTSCLGPSPEGNSLPPIMCEEPGVACGSARKAPGEASM